MSVSVCVPIVIVLLLCGAHLINAVHVVKMHSIHGRLFNHANYNGLREHRSTRGSNNTQPFAARTFSSHFAYHRASESLQSLHNGDYQGDRPVASSTSYATATAACSSSSTCKSCNPFSSTLQGLRQGHEKPEGSERLIKRLVKRGCQGAEGFRSKRCGKGQSRHTGHGSCRATESLCKENEEHSWTDVSQLERQSTACRSRSQNVSSYFSIARTFTLALSRHPVALQEDSFKVQEHEGCCGTPGCWHIHGHCIVIIPWTIAKAAGGTGRRGEGRSRANRTLEVNSPMAAIDSFSLDTLPESSGRNPHCLWVFSGAHLVGAFCDGHSRKDDRNGNQHAQHGGRVRDNRQFDFWSVQFNE